MDCYYCGGSTKRSCNLSRNGERHRWFRCTLCGKTSHTVETYVIKGPPKDCERSRHAVLGSKNPNSVLTEADVLRMRDLAAQGTSTKELVRMYGVAAATISRIVNRRTWSHI
jgi:hypothetical protein